jgi:hypothetical protein
MIPANAPNAALDSTEVRNGGGNVGVPKITTLPAPHRNAYLLRDTRLKSHSGTVVMAPREPS